MTTTWAVDLAGRLNIGGRSRGTAQDRTFMTIGACALLFLLFGATRLASPLRLGLYLLANYLLFADVLDFAMRLYLVRRHTGALRPANAPTSIPLDVGRFTEAQVALHVRPYAFILSVHDLGDEVDEFIEAMRPFRDRVRIIDDASTDATVTRLRRSGFQCLAGTTNRRKPGALRVLLDQLEPEIETVIVLDPDCRIAADVTLTGSLERLIFEFQRSGMAAATPRVRVREAGLLASLQAFEYGMTFSILRRSLGDHSVTSGASMYRRDALASALRQHDLSVYAEDFENTLILLSQGERIYYDERLVLETGAKLTWRALFSQRAGWSFGLLRLYASQVERLGGLFFRNLSTAYHFLAYAGVFGILLYPLRLLMSGLLIASTLNCADYLLGLDLVPDVPGTDPRLFLVAYVQYTVFAMILMFTAIRSEERARLAPIIPLYFFYAVGLTVPATFGYLNWISLRLFGRRVYRDHFDDPGLRAASPAGP